MNNAPSPSTKVERGSGDQADSEGRDSGQMTDFSNRDDWPPGLGFKEKLGELLHGHVGVQLYDDSGDAAQGIAIYSLSDPRDIREVRYVGRTSVPRRRFLQHLNTAMLWMPDDKPWWVKFPKMRPLSEWIRELYRDELRLPVMVVTAWVPTVSDARVVERGQIYECLAKRLRLLNVESEMLGRQLALI
jgi:hypothetical protein